MAQKIEIIGNEIIRKFLDAVAPAVVDRIEQATEKVRRQAEAEWPVGRRTRKGKFAAFSRPHSRDLFRSSVRLERDGTRYRIVGSVQNGADYWRFVKAKKLRGGSALVAFVRRPMERERDAIRDDLRHLIPEALRG